MILKINLAEDDQLRNSVRTIVQQQVVSIVREEVTRQVEEKIDKVLNKLIDEGLEDRLKLIIGDRWSSTSLLNAGFTYVVHKVVLDTVEKWTLELTKEEILTSAAEKIARKFEL